MKYDKHIWAIPLQLAFYFFKPGNWISIHILCFQFKIEWKGKS